MILGKLVLVVRVVTAVCFVTISASISSRHFASISSRHFAEKGHRVVELRLLLPGPGLQLIVHPLHAADHFLPVPPCRD